MTAMEPPSECDKNLEKHLLAELRCSICTFYMAPPIQQCVTGHNFCQECFNLINRCVKCYSPKGTTRNQLLEKLYYQVNLPCKYASNGCDFLAKSESLPAHEDVCSYTIRKCPFNFTCMCSWQGVIYEIEEHCYDLHHYSVNRGAEIAKVFISFEEGFIDGYAMYMIFAYNALFRFTSHIDKEERVLKFTTMYLGQKFEEHRYVYQVKFLRSGTEKSAITLKAECAYLADHTKPFAENNYLTLPLDVLKPFCDVEGDLHYVLRIIENSPTPNLSGPSTSKK